MAGMRVAVVGPDGAGKSTLIESIRNTVPLPTRVIYMGLSAGALRHARRLRVPGLVFAASAAIIWARYLRGRYHQGLGHLVLFDRYVYDAFTPHPAQLTTAQHLSRRASGFLCPQPDVTIFLDAPGSVMHARKPSYTAPMLENWRWHFRALETRISRLHVIDATRGLDAVRVDAVTEIWRRCAFRWQRADPMSACP
jgi:thymidylate kinase